MHYTNKLVIIAAIILLPLIPVGFLWQLFGEANLFKTDGVGKLAFEAGGPMGAYAVLFFSLMSQFKKEDVEKCSAKVVGEWDFVSHSKKGSEATGVCSIREDGGDLTLTGTFSEGDRIAGAESWTSTLVIVKENLLHYVHELPAEGGSYQNFVHLHITSSNSRAIRLEGHWYAMRDELKRGNIVFTRTS